MIYKDQFIKKYNEAFGYYCDKNNLESSLNATN